jgi:hypothetical protein
VKKILICLLLFFTVVFSVRAEKIDSFDSKISINKDGTIDVKETIVYDFEDIDRHGILRNIPYIKTNTAGKKFKMDFSGFSVTDENSFAYRYTKSTIDSGISLKIGDPDRTISGVHTYIISYKVGGTLTYFSDHDELYWNITGNDWTVPITKATASVVLPKEISEENLRITCYTGSFGETGESCSSSINKEIFIETDSPLSSYQGLTVVVGFPIDIVSRLEPKEVISFWETFIGKIVIFFLALLAGIWYIFLPFHIIYKWYKEGRDPKGTTGVTTAWFDPPKNPKGNRFLTPAEVGTLGDETVDMKDISSMIIDLARRGFIKIEERAKKDFYLIQKSPKDRKASLLPIEKLLLDKFFKSGTEIRLKTAELYSDVEEIKKKLYEQTVTEGLFPKNPQSVRTIYYAISFLALFTANFLLALVAFIFGRVMPRKTVEGVNAFHVAQSLKNFLTSQERQLKFQADKQLMFERLLPYAVAFGVEKIWAKRFENMNLKQPSWYSGYGTGQFNSVIFASSLNSSMTSFRSAATPTSSSSGFSSGFSGGSSGGGGGGGGGGSW